MSGLEQRNQYEFTPYRHSASDMYRGMPNQDRKHAVENQDEHPQPRLMRIYKRLAVLVPKMPRDADGGADASYVRGALAVEGIDVDKLSLECLAELLARCDISATGFPSFGDFVMCFKRPQDAAVIAAAAAAGSLSREDSELLAAEDAAAASARRAREADALAQVYARRAEQLARVYAKGNRSAEELAKIYARGARLHAGYLQPGLSRQMNTAEVPLTAEVLARVAGGERTMPGPLSRPDGYRLDESGSYMGILPGLEHHRAWGEEDYREELDNGNWVVLGGHERSDDGDARDASIFGGGGVAGAGNAAGGTKGFGSAAGGGAIPDISDGNTQYFATPGGDGDWLKTFGSMSGGGLMARGNPASAGEALANPMVGGKPSNTRKQSDRRAFHVAKGHAIVPSPNKAGPASSWRKFA